MTLVGTGIGAGPRAEQGLPRVLARGLAESLTPEAATPLWSSLAERAATDNPFFDPDFLAPAADALHAAVEPVAVRAANGDLLGWMPLTSARLGRVAPALRVWAHDFGPLGTPVVDAERAADAMSALVETALERAGDRAALIFPYLPEDAPVTPLIEAAAHNAERSVIRLDSHQRAIVDRGNADLHTALHRKRRKEYARQLRRLADIGPVTFEHAVTSADIAKRFEEFLTLEASGWKGRRGSAMASEPEIATFCRTAVDALARRGNASALTLRVGDRPAAMLLCLHEGHTAVTWKIAYDETLAHYSPGAQLMLEAPRFLFADARIQRIDSLATPNHPMVDPIWPDRMPVTTLVVCPRRSRWLGQVGLTTHRAEAQLRKLVHQMRRTMRRSTR